VETRVSVLPAMQVRPRALIVTLGCALAAVLCLILLWAVPPATLKDEMTGASYQVRGILNTSSYLGFEYNAFGLFKPELSLDGTTYCWTTEQATLNFPYAANAGPQMEVAIRLAGNRGQGQPPAQVTVSLNGKAEPTFEATDGYQVYTFPLDARAIPNPYRDPSNVQVDIVSTTFNPPADPRKLGVAVDWIEIQGGRSNAMMAADVAVWVAAMLLLLLIATSRMSMAYSIAYGLAALLTFVVVQATYVPRAIPPAMEVGLAGLAWMIAALLAPRRRPLWGFGLAACLLWLVVAGRVLGDFEVDDAYISYRYAWNLVHGNGLVFNPGEVVEGYTNFLWTMLSAIPIALGVLPAGVALAANIALSLGVVGLTYVLAGRLADDGRWTMDDGRFNNPHSAFRMPQSVWPLLAAFLMTVDVSLITFGARGSGMETVLFAFLALLSVALSWAGPRPGNGMRALAGVSLALAALTRPEGLLVAVLVLGARTWQDRVEKTPIARPLLAAMVPFLVIIVPYEVWRTAFYGYPFPNTFYAKTGISVALVERGAAYTWTFVTEHWLPVALMFVGVAVGIASIIASRGRREDGSRRAVGSETSGLRLALVLLVVVYCSYIVVVGGDWLVADRFFVPLLAPIVLLGVEAARLAISSLPLSVVWRSMWAVALVVAVVLYTRDAVQLEDRQGTVGLRTESDMINTEWWGAAGLWLRDNTPPQTLVAAQGVGAIAYYSQRPVIDLLGLNDVHIAHVEVADMGEGKAGHEKSDPAYVLSRSPDYILVVWKYYFAPVQQQLDREYHSINVRNQRGWVVTWLRKKD